MPHHCHLCEDQIMHPARVRVRGVEDVVGPMSAIAPIGRMLALMRTPMMIMIVWNQAISLCRVTATLLSRVPTISFVVLAVRLVLVRALNLYLALALLSSSLPGLAKILTLGSL